MARAAKPLPLMIMCHGRPTVAIARRFGWLPGARYTNLRDIRGFAQIGLIDVDWKKYNYSAHLEAVRQVRPLLTIAKDVVDIAELPAVLRQAKELQRWAGHVVIVPKDESLGPKLRELVPRRFLLGYSVPTSYGETLIPIECFGRRRVHLLGGRPDVQFHLAGRLNVFSIDGNRITVDARYGDYFTGSGFRPHPEGGYYTCIRESLREVNRLWKTRLVGTNPRSRRRG